MRTDQHRVSDASFRFPIAHAVFIVRAPFFHGIQDRLQAVSCLGQRVFHPRRNFRIDLAVNKPLSSIARRLAVNTF